MDFLPDLALMLVFLLMLVLMLQWVCWIFRWGRFKVPTSGGQPSLLDGTSAGGQPRGVVQSTVYIIGNFITTLIDDFRHLLALIIVLIFGAALAYAMYKADGSLPGIRDALQAVAATLGGLVGSIIGYYYGESAAGKALSARVATQRTAPSVVGTEGSTGQGPGAPNRSPEPEGSSEANRNAPPPPKSQERGGE
jgi:hypothetical protein